MSERDGAQSNHADPSPKAQQGKRHSGGSAAGKALSPISLLKGSPIFCAGLTLGCGVTFLLLFVLFNSPLSPLLDLNPPSNLRLSLHSGGSVFPQPFWGLTTRAAHSRALVRAINAHAPPDIKERCISIVQGNPSSLKDSFAQAGQDWLLFHNFFFHIPYGKGTYLDIGSNHPKDLSNTYFFDKCLGWRGVCVEPNPQYHPLYEKFNRTCSLVKACLADREGMKRMNFKKGAHGKVSRAGQEVECSTLSNVVATSRMAYADLASVDIEGSEYQVLRCFPFKAYKISTWLVETDKAALDLFRHFARNSYAYVGDILCPLRSLHSDRTRVGVKLDSVFRFLEPSFIFGPPFLPGRSQAGAGPRGPCRAWSKGDSACPEQVPVIEVGEVHVQNMTLRDGVCGLPSSLSSRSEFALPISEHPNIYKA